MKIAAVAYAMDPLPSFEAFAEKLEACIAEAAADLIVFPEYAAMELAAISGQAGDLACSIDAVTEILPDVDALHARLARKYQATILAASAPLRVEDRVVNRARIFAPKGATGHQDKQIMTRFEREEWGISAGDPLTVFDLDGTRIAVLICYDAEFPLLARAVGDAGADILLVPSCTDTPHGWNRVRVGAMARALENQCLTVQAPTVGSCPWCPAVDENFGAAAIFGPPDTGFPADGVLAQSALDRPGLARAEVDLGALARVRQSGAQLNRAHWPEQETRLQGLRNVTLR